MTFGFSTMLFFIIFFIERTLKQELRGKGGTMENFKIMLSFQPSCPAYPPHHSSSLPSLHHHHSTSCPPYPPPFPPPSGGWEGLLATLLSCRDLWDRHCDVFIQAWLSSRFQHSYGFKIIHKLQDIHRCHMTLIF